MALLGAAVVVFLGRGHVTVPAAGSGPSLTTTAAQLQAHARVILVTLDGARWQDVLDQPGALRNEGDPPAMPKLLELIRARGVALPATTSSAVPLPAAAVGNVGQAVAGLVGAGPRFVVNGQELPVLGQDGAKAMGKLFERVVDALPPQAKAKALQKVADISAKAGKNVVPVIGPALGIIGEAQELHAGIQRKPHDYLSTAVDGSQLVLHVASLFPAAQPLRAAHQRGSGLHRGGGRRAAAHRGPSGLQTRVHWPCRGRELSDGRARLFG